MSNQDQEDAKVRVDMQRLAKYVDSQLPYGWFFVLLASSCGKDGRVNYVSNAERKDVVRLMYEFIEATKSQWGLHEKELSGGEEDEQLGRARQRIAELEGELEKYRRRYG